MHPDFADWYRIVDPSPTAELLGLRWEGVESFCQEASRDKVLNIVRLHYRVSTLDDFRSQFQEIFKSIDTTFPNRNNEELLAILAGACIANLLRNDRQPMSDNAALAVMSASFLGCRRGALEDMSQQAERYVYERSLSRIQDNDPGTIRGVEIDADDLKAKLKQYCQANDNVTHLSLLLHEMLTEFADTTSHFAEFANALHQRQKLQLEESNILWWLFGEFSRDLDIPLAEVGMPGVCLIAAKELVGLVSVIPGPCSAKAFLHKAISFSADKLPTSVTLYETVNQSDRDWRSQWINTIGADEVREICPAILAVRKSLETPRKTEWVPAFETLTGLKAKQPLKPLDLAMQVYHEALLLRSLAETT